MMEHLVLRTNRVTDKVMGTAPTPIASGLINNGYIYVNIDDCGPNGAERKKPNSPPRDAAGSTQR